VKIQVLADSVVNKIAAGEVVERPASVVRELVDNALDAGAQAIEVTLEHGGKSLVRVVDDGLGMERDDVLLALQRHATSKITSAEDLATVGTRGFRGEALPSIASVSRMVITSRTKELDLGVTVSVDGGAIKSVDSAPCAVGSSVSVKTLFFNTPVRKKFLRSDRVEEDRVFDWFVRFAFGAPSVRLRLVADGRELLALPPHSSFMERASGLIRGSATSCSLSEEGIHIEGVVGHPGASQSDAAQCVVLVNNRPVSDRGFLRASREGYHATLKEKEVPAAALSITLDPTLVDINVHPQKSEVRFVSPHAIWRVVRKAVHQAVGSITMPFEGGVALKPIPQVRATDVQVIYQSSFDYQPVTRPSTSQGAPASPYQPRAQGAGAWSEGNLLLDTSQFPAYEPEQSSIPIKETEIGGGQQGNTIRYRDLRYIGQALGCYLVCEYRDELVIVDMHAAHERIQYNRIRSAFRSSQPHAQRLLVPMTVSLGVVLRRAFVNQIPLLERWGFEIALSGEDAVVVSAVPTCIPESEVPQTLNELARYGIACEADGEALGDSLLEKRIDAIAARLACHASVRGGDTISRENAYALLASLDGAELAGACPHGRPVLARFSRGGVERWFGRDR
jgi:DNA mismatch repair protein MutL